MQVLSKGDFAAHIGVSAGRVSQYIAAGYIGRDAMQGEGRNARIIVPIAIEQIRRKRDIGQSLGNGLSTRLDLLDEPAQTAAATDAAAPAAPPAPREPSVEDQIKAERLKAEKRKNDEAEIARLERGRQLVPAAELRRQLKAVATAMDEEAGGMLADFATAIAAEYHLVQRDVLHLLKGVRTQKKAAAAERARQRANDLPETAETALEGVAA